MLDEPELHLNADLIRAWIAFLTGTVVTGQIWLATHSLEAVEAAGQKATFVLERNEETRKVDSLARLDTRPILSALSRAVGTPAFSISQLLFVFVEGEESVGERERFRSLSGLQQNVRFMECGPCNEVLRRVASIKAIARESETGIRIGGVVDRDFRSNAEADALSNDNGVLVLPVHEIENYFLHPVTLGVLLQQNGRGQLDPTNLIRDAADARAGSWIFQNAMATRNAKTLPELPIAAKELAKGLNWEQIDVDRNATIQRIVAASEYAADDQRKLEAIFKVSRNIYEANDAKRTSGKFAKASRC